MVVLAPSILSGNHINLLSSLEQIRDSGARWAHLDIMDGNFVSNLTFGPQAVKELSKFKGNLFFDVHLMIQNPDDFVEKFIDAGADLISFHIESTCCPEKIINKIHNASKKVGIAINPKTPPEIVFNFLDTIDLILVMGVNPGFGGQKFIKKILNKIATIRRKNPSINIEVDGGITLGNAINCVSAGANIIVAGSAFFASNNRKNFVRQIENE